MHAPGVFGFVEKRLMLDFVGRLESRQFLNDVMNIVSIQELHFLECTGAV